MDPSHGGPCQGIRNAIPALEAWGVHNEVVSLDAPGAAFLGKDPFPVHATGPSGKGWRYSSKLIPWLLENLLRFDAVIVHGLWLYHSYAVSKAIRRLKYLQGTIGKAKVPKLYIMPHGMLDPYFQQAPERKLKAIRNWIYYKLIEGSVINKADAVLFTCEEELQLAQLPFTPYKPKREINIGYGIAEPPAYTSTMQNAFLEKCPGLNKRPFILFLSRLHNKKGVDLLITAYANFLKSKAITDHANITNQKSTISDIIKDQLSPALVIAGPGLETKYGNELQQFVIKSPELKESVFFTGMLSGNAKWGAFYGCETFILPSHQENFGIAVVEALACNKPVLISNKVNIWREIEASGGGIVANDTIEGINELLFRWNHISPEEKNSMGKKARYCYENNFSITCVAERFMQKLQV